MRAEAEGLPAVKNGDFRYQENFSLFFFLVDFLSNKISKLLSPHPALVLQLVVS